VRAKHLVVEQPPSIPTVLVTLQVIPPWCHRSWIEATCHCWPGTCLGQSEPFQLVRSFNWNWSTFVKEAICHCWPGTCFGRSEPFQLVTSNCNWVWFLESESELNFIFLRTGLRNQVLGFIYIVQSELEPEPKYMSLRKKTLTRKEVNYQLTTGFWSELVRTRPKLGLIFKTKTRIFF